jgi:glycosyltransferase involved in cell wall biosynthesis
MKIAYVTAGAAGMFCGSCMHDNTLAGALRALGHDTVLIPTYTPIHTDERDNSQQRVFFGGVNVYLEQKYPWFRRLPRGLTRVFDRPGLLRWVSKFAVDVDAQNLGELTVSMLKGEHGNQAKEVADLVGWLADDLRPDVVVLTAALLAGVVPELKRRLAVPVVCLLQGDDIYTESLPEPHRSRALGLIRDHCQTIDGFLAPCAYYADFMAGYFGAPRDRINVIPLGLDLAGHGEPRARPDGPPYQIGYFARVCKEKGFHVLVEAFRILCQTPGAPPCRLRVSGWLGAGQRPFFEEQLGKIQKWGLADRFEYVESPDHASKVRFLQDIDVLSVPTTYREPKGLYVLEALANGVPVVQPRHGSFPELIDATGGGLLVNPDDPADLAAGLRRLLEDAALREELGRKGREAVHRAFTAAAMARRTADVLSQYTATRLQPV